MKALRKIVGVTCVGLALLLVFAAGSAQAQPGCCVNPLFLPFAVAGAVLGTAAAVVSAPFHPCASYDGPGYYAPPPPYYGYGYGPRPYYHRQVWRHDHDGRYYQGRSERRVYRQWNGY
jgi:hypothetical protein